MKKINIVTICLFTTIVISGFLISFKNEVIGQTETDCQCIKDFRWDGSKCIESKDDFACIQIFDPVCGCDGMTYSNGCLANLDGVKKFAQGECNSSSSGSLTCITDSDCPLGVCADGKTFLNYSCGDGKCNQIFYFVDPCRNFSSSGSEVTLNKNFTGVWVGRIKRVRSIRALAHVSETTFGSSMLTFKLCVKDGKLNGTVSQSGVLTDGVITSQSIVSENEIEITAMGKNDISTTINLKLTGNRQFIGTFSDGHTFEARKVGLNKSCPKSTCLNCALVRCANPGKPPEGCKLKRPILPNGCKSCCEEIVCSSSGQEKNCSSKASCRGQNGTYLVCPEGTECSGLPAYGCYPPGCPVPICLSPNTRIRTDGIQKRVQDIKEGDIVLTDNEKPVKVLKTSKVEVKNHKILYIVLNDSTVLEISPGHPTSDGRLFKDLKVGDFLDKKMVIKTKLIQYDYKYTYDILPDSKTGNYYANGVLIGSTLKR